MLRKSLYRLLGICVMNLSLSLLSGCGEKEEAVYRETTVEYGSLVVGVTESGSVDIDTVEQTFDLDMHALQRVEISDGQGAGSGMSSMMGMGGGATFGGSSMNMFSQIFDRSGGSSLVGGDESSNLVVREVCVTVGQQVEVGDVLYLLEEEGVADLKEELESNVSKAKADLEAVIADQKLSSTTAQYTYESSIAYGSFAATEKENTLAELEKNVSDKEKALTQARTSLTTYENQLAQLNIEYESALQVQRNVTWSRDNTNKRDELYLYTIYAQEAIETDGLVESIEQEKEQLESRVEQAKENIVKCEKEVASAKRSLEAGKLSANETYELRQLAYENANETFDVTMAYLESDLAAQEEIYEEADEKWKEFTSYINENAVCAQYSGVITEVGLAEGDNLTTGTVVATLYDAEAVSMTVSVNEEDMTDIVVGGKANISFTAYPDDIYRASVSEISDASTDSSGNVTYDVTVIIEDDSDGLFQGMTGDVTFITKKSEEAMYVLNRAIIRDGKMSYVTVKDGNNIRKVEVKTGFSDGTNVEIVEGLNVGDVVLIESKVQKGEAK